MVDSDGQLINSRRIAGSDFDSLLFAELSENGFVLSVRSQSEDGDFSGWETGGYPAECTVYLDRDLETVEVIDQPGREFDDYVIGEKEGEPVHLSDLKTYHFDAGSPIALIDYGDTYLLVSQIRIETESFFTGKVRYEWETVYAAYDQDDNLLFRTLTDQD